MRKRQFRALIALNAVLLAALAVVSLSPAAEAQRGNRARGQYTLVAGMVQGAEVEAVYVVDASNQEMVALYWDRNRNGFGPLGYRSLAEDAAIPSGGGR